MQRVHAVAVRSRNPVICIYQAIAENNVALNFRQDWLVIANRLFRFAFQQLSSRPKAQAFTAL
jgi:hypothetical protein